MQTVEDCALLTQDIAGLDAKDSTLSNQPVLDYRREMKKEIKSVKVAYLKDDMLKGIDSDVKEPYEKIPHNLKDMGAELHEMDFPMWEYVFALPVCLTRQKMPVGIQIIENFFQEAALFKLAFLVEKKVKSRKQAKI